MTGMTRRDVLWGGALAALAGGTLPWWKLATAQDAPPRRNLVVVFVNGGWDTTACIDPKPGLTTIDSPPGEVKGFGELDVLVGDDRPAVEAFFASYASMTTLVRGVEVRSIAHEECTKRILTGTNSGTRPDLGAMTGVSLGDDLAVPYMILGNTAFTGPYGGSTGRSGAAGQLVRLLHHRAAYPPPAGKGAHRFDPELDEKILIRDWLKARADAQLEERARHGVNRQRMVDFRRSMSRSDRLRQLVNNFGDPGFQLEFRPQIELGVRMLAEGMSNAVLIEHNRDWDSHFGNHAAQIVNHQDLFGGLSLLAERLDSGGLLEDTLVAVISEMSRTPRLNAQQGKDHWPVTSAMLFGGLVGDGSRVMGATNELFESRRVDLATGVASDEGERLTSPAFVAGVLARLGVEPGAFFPDTSPLAI